MFEAIILLLHTLYPRDHCALTRVGFTIGVLLTGLSGGGDLHTSSVLPATTAPAEPSVDDVLANVRKAIGYEQLKRYEHGIIVEGTTDEYWVDGKYSLMFAQDGKFIEKVDSKLSRSFGFDGTTGWAVDYAGVPQRVDLAELELEQLLIWVYAMRWLDPNNGYSIALLDQYTDDQRVALSIKLNSGVWEMWLVIERSTWLPTSIYILPNLKGHIMRLEDYRPALGFRIPHRILKSNSGPIIKTVIHSVRAAPIAIQIAYAPLSKRPGDTRFNQEIPPDVECKITETHHVLVHPRIDGQDVGWFLLDTGSSHMIVDRKVADRLHMPSLGQESIAAAGGGIGEARNRRGRTFELGPITISSPLYYEVDLSDLNPSMNVELAGVCGYDLFRRAVIELGIAHRSVRIYDPDTYRREHTDWQEFFYTTRRPSVYCRFEGDRTGLFTIDTGSNSTASFHTATVKKFDLLTGKKVTRGKNRSVVGEYENLNGNIHWFEIGGNRVDGNPPVSFEIGEAGWVRNLLADGNIGTAFLVSFKIIFDYPHKRIAFIKLDDTKEE